MSIQARTAYQGPDRRQQLVHGTRRPYVRRAASAVGLTIGLWIIGAILIRSAPHSIERPFTELTHSLSGALLLAAAALRFAVWRVTRTARAAWSVIIFAVAGTAAPIIAIIGRAVTDNSAHSGFALVARNLLELTLIAFSFAALTCPAIVTRLQPLRIAVPVIIVSVVAAGFTISNSDPASWTPGTVTGPGLSISVAAGWCLVSFLFIVSGRRRHVPLDIAIGAAVLILALGATIRAVLGSVPYHQMLVPVGFQFAVCSVALGIAGIGLWRLQSGRNTQCQTITNELRHAESALAEAEQGEATRLHDARNAILAVSGAVHVLTRRSFLGNSNEAEHLRKLAALELDRLVGLLDPPKRRENVPFSPAEILRPLILAHELAGNAVTTDLEDCRAIGRADTVSTAVANVLANARKHAPGAHVWITLESFADNVHICISDDGPGIPTSQHSLVQLPGVRSGGSDLGSGLGLASAAQAMSDQGGTLRINDRPGGGTMITLTLQKAPERTERDSAPAMPLSQATP